MGNRNSLITTTDNTKEPKPNIGDLSDIANIPLDEIEKDNVLVFPQKWAGGISSEHTPIFRYYTKTQELETSNIMGFIGKGNTELFIQSRFDKDNNNYFLHYMLQKVFSLNIVNLDISSGNESILDLLVFLFPALLQNALSQGIFKQYKRMKYNDSNVKGAIDINRHIKLNIPFTGKIAYTTREHSIDNSVTQLVRHTIEYLRTRPVGHSILTCNSDIRANVSKIEYATPSYKRGDVRKIISANRQAVNHPYFTKYRPLQKLCLQILRRENVNVGDKDELHGVLFDGAWLWEEYINTIIKNIFWHPKNKKFGNEKTYPQRLFNKQNEGLIYPDFVSKNTKNRIIADAKYKPITNIQGNDYLQLLAYMFRFDSTRGYYIYPGEDSTVNNENYNLLKGAKFDNEETVGERDDKIIVTKFGLKIPQTAENFGVFVSQIEKNERALLSELALPK